MTSLTDNQIRYSKYKWEFLRRNDEYIVDWKQFIKTMEDDSIHPKDGSMAKPEIEFCKKWKIASVLDPDQSYDEYVNFSSISEEGDRSENSDTTATKQAPVDYGIDIYRRMFNWLFPEFFPGRPIVVEDGWDIFVYGATSRRFIEGHFAKHGKLRIQIDLKYSKRKLMQELKALIDDWKILYEDSHKKLLFNNFCADKGVHKFSISEEQRLEFEKVYEKSLKKDKKKYKQKHHFDNFDIYLDVYDLRKKGTSWSKLTKQLKLNSIQTARNHYNTAVELINGGIELYVK